MKFSERYGHVEVRKSLQVDSMDGDLRSSLWNIFYTYYWAEAENTPSHDLREMYKELIIKFFESIWADFFKAPLDEINNRQDLVLSRVRGHFFDAVWYHVYDFIEFTLQCRNVNGADPFIDDINQALEREMSGYRCLNGCVTKITDDGEMDAIGTAIQASEDPIATHLESALKLLSDRANPDFRNSIKESISAVESLVKRATGSEKGTLGALLKAFQGKTNLHPALKEAFLKLYGYASDEDGIRHGMIDSDKTDFHDAKFMLVACSAFINYVKGKSG